MRRIHSRSVRIGLLFAATVVLGLQIGSAETTLEAWGGNLSGPRSKLYLPCNTSLPHDSFVDDGDDNPDRPPVLRNSSRLASNVYAQSTNTNPASQTDRNTAQGNIDRIVEFSCSSLSDLTGTDAIEETLSKLALKKPPVSKKMMEAMKCDDPEVRILGVTVLGRIKHLEATQSIKNMINNDREPEVRIAACEALSLFGDINFMTPVLDALEDPEDQVRLSAVFSLVPFYKVPAVQKALTASVRDEVKFVSAAATKALNGERIELFNLLPPPPKLESPAAIESPSRDRIEPYGFQSPPPSPYKGSPSSGIRRSESTTPRNSKDVTLPNFEVINEEIWEAPLKTQIKQHIVVSGSISVDGLTALLYRLYDSVMARRGFKYHRSPTVTGIYAYTSKDRAASGMGQWVAMLIKLPSDSEPHVNIKDKQIALLSVPSEERFELSENQRIKIFQEYILVCRKAQDDSDKEHPEDPTQSLHPGSNFKLTRHTPLAPEFRPRDPLQALEKIRTIPEGCTIKVNRVEDNDGFPWYHVNVTDQRGSVVGSGWINSTALRGQANVNFDEQSRKRRQLEETLRLKFEENLAEKYAIKLYHLRQISLEGSRKDWPLPKSK
jgi:hypothetical protein